MSAQIIESVRVTKHTNQELRSFTVRDAIGYRLEGEYIPVWSPVYQVVSRKEISNELRPDDQG